MTVTRPEMKWLVMLGDGTEIEMHVEQTDYVGFRHRFWCRGIIDKRLFAAAVLQLLGDASRPQWTDVEWRLFCMYKPPHSESTVVGYGVNRSKNSFDATTVLV